MKKLTQRQLEILRFIEQNVMIKGFPPSVREIATHFGLNSASGIHKHLKALVRKNYISKENFRSRSLRILKPDTVPTQKLPTPMMLPVAGSLWAQTPSDGIAPSPLPADLPEGLHGNVDYGYFLTINGKAWQDQGIQDGDNLLIMPNHPVYQGLAVVAVIDAREFAIGRFYRSDEMVSLANFNDETVRRTFAARSVHLRGVIAGIWRTLPLSAPLPAA